MSRKEKTKTTGFNLGFTVNLTVFLLFTALGFGLYIFFMKELESQKLKELMIKSKTISEDIIKENLLPADSTKSANHLFSSYVKNYNIVYCILTSDSSHVMNTYNYIEAEKNNYLKSGRRFIHRVIFILFISA
jgi:hypothetical protein